jgi:hypothetical protein
MATLKKPNTVGGGAQTNKNGLAFEARANLLIALENDDRFDVNGNMIFFQGNLVGRHFEKHRFLKDFVKGELGIDSKDVWSKDLLPDGVFITEDQVTVIEVKFQAGSGSVDEKLQTCDFKKKKYEKLLAGTKYKVNFYFVLNDWFKHPRYEDVFSYINSVGCRYFFNSIPFDVLGLKS